METPSERVIRLTPWMEQRRKEIYLEREFNRLTKLTKERKKFMRELEAIVLPSIQEHHKAS